MCCHLAKALEGRVMNKLLGHLICASLLMSTSAALSDNHLDGTVKFQNGEKYAGCVYGQNGKNIRYVIDLDKYEKDQNRNVSKDLKKEVSECGIAWEGKGLYHLVVDRGGGLTLEKEDELFDLQKAYNCCTTDETRLAICKREIMVVDTNSCPDYLDSMRGNLPGGVQQPEANDAAEYGCIKAVSGNVADYKEWLLSSEYHGRLDKLFEVCEQKGTIESAISHMFDFLRDETGCLWNSPDDDFCAGSRRREGGWEVTK
jgi:hypothetical protein